MSLRAQKGGGLYATPGCSCDECAACRRDRRRKDKLRKMGRGVNTTAEEYALAVARIAELRSRGMTLRLIAQAIGCGQPSIHRHSIAAYGKMRRDIYKALMAIEWNPAALSGTSRNGGARVDRCGVRRRLSALYARGFSYSWQSSALGHNSNVVEELMLTKRPTVAYQTYLEVKELYDKWQDRDPITDGAMTQRAVTLCRRDAARKGLAPPACWDEHTIDDPTAQPDWGTAQAPVLDEVAIERALSGVPTELTRLERREVLRRLAASISEAPAVATKETGPDERYINAAVGLGLAEKSVRTEVGRIRREDTNTHGSEEQGI